MRRLPNLSVPLEPATRKKLDKLAQKHKMTTAAYVRGLIEYAVEAGWKLTRPAIIEAGKDGAK